MGAWRGGLLVAVALVAATAGPTAAEEPDLREGVRAILTTHCGKCHRSDTLREPPSRRVKAALKVYDLAEPDFAARLKPRQLPIVLARLDGSDASADERAQVVAFLAAEEARRAAPR